MAGFSFKFTLGESDVVHRSAVAGILFFGIHHKIMESGVIENCHLGAVRFLPHHSEGAVRSQAALNILGVGKAFNQLERSLNQADNFPDRQGFSIFG
jgi:hypothetical protein